ncbi:MAG: DUF2157 domain-containing protein [Gammaproteobacteria bacterium]
MRIISADLDAAVDARVISAQQAADLWRFLQERGADQPGFKLSHLLYYLGGLLAIGALSLFITLAWETLGGWGLCAIALLYMLLGVGLTEYLLARQLKIPAGLTAALVVSLTPLAVYGLQRGLGLWEDEAVYQEYHQLISWRWILMELATLALGAVALWRYRLPFLLMPVAVTLWYMSMDLAPFLFGVELTWELRRDVSMWFGLGMLALALAVDLRFGRRLDFAFWLYLFGTLAFWCGLTLRNSDSELAKFLYFLINLFLVFIGAALRRRVLTVFGGLGMATYLGYLAYDVFRFSLLFPVVLSFIGFGVIWLGIVWQRHEARLGGSLRALLPARLRQVIEVGD